MDYFADDYHTAPGPNAMSAILEDSIMQKGRPVTAGSKTLENYISPLDATVVTRIEAAGVSILGKAVMDEFGTAGLFTDGFEEPSGAVSAVADGAASFALCNDYTGSVRQQAAARGLCYIRPTYGTVSRYGLIHAVSSMDQIGIVCKTPEEGFKILAIIAGHDRKDGAMYPPCENEKVAGGNIRIAVPADIISRAAAQDVSAVAEFSKHFETVDIELKYYDVYDKVMQILCCAEISSNLTRYDGIKFGYRADGFRGLHGLYTKSRTESLGADAKLAALAGAMVVSQDNYNKYYDKAMRIRRLIKQSLEFDRHDAIIMPLPAGTAGASCRSGDTVEPGYAGAAANDAAAGGARLALCALPQLCGLPSVTIMYQGGIVTLAAAAKQEDILSAALQIAAE